MKKILSMLLVLCMALTLCSAAFAEGKSPVAVSYTHLDVYKRQAGACIDGHKRFCH